MVTARSRHVVVIGKDEVGRRTAAMLQDAGAQVKQLDEPTDGQLHELLGGKDDGVAVGRQLAQVVEDELVGDAG